MQSSRMTTRISPTYEWRPLLPHEEFRHGECWHNDKPGDEEGEETEVPLGYLVEFAFRDTSGKGMAHILYDTTVTKTC